MNKHPGAAILGALGGTLLAFLIMGGSVVVATAAKPHLWLEMLIVLWAAPFALAGFSFGVDIVINIIGRYSSMGSTWHWLDRPQRR